MGKTKRNELSNLLRRLADYVDNRTDDELIPLIMQAATLKPDKVGRRKSQGLEKISREPAFFSKIANQLQALTSRDAGEAFLRDQELNRTDLEGLARNLQLPVQRDDTVERLRAKIVENVIGTRLRSDAIQGVPPR